MTPSVRKLLDFSILQAGWFVAVLGAAAGNEWVGPVAVVAFIALHILWIAPVAKRRTELSNVLVFGLAGCVIDAVQTHFGVLRFHDGTFTIAGIPPWLVALWLLFPILFNSAFEWLHGRPWLAAALALVGGPLSYRAGVAMDAIYLGSDEWASLTSLGVAWAIYLPVAIRTARK